MATDWNTPTLSQLWANFLAAIKGRDESAAKMDFTGDTNLPTGVIRYNRTSSRFEEWNGTAWVALMTDLTSTIGVLPASQFTDTAHGARAGGTLHSAASGTTAGFLTTTDKNKLDGATSAPTVSTLMQRDAAGRTQVVAPAVADDVARKDTVDTHAGLTTGVHGVGVSTVESIGGAQAKVDVHAALVAAGTHGATAAPSANSIMFRDANARAKVAAPAAADDIARKAEVDAVWVDPVFSGGTGGARFTKGLAVDTGLPANFPNYPARMKQQVNGQYCLELLRQTDIAPTGSLLRVLNAAYSAVLAEITTAGNVRAPGFYTNGDASYLRDDGLVVPNAANLTGVTFSGGLITSNSVGIAALKTSPNGNVFGDITTNFSLNDYALAPNFMSPDGGRHALQFWASPDPGSTVAQGRVVIVSPPNAWQIRWRYITASDDPHIYVVVDPATGEVRVVWVSDDPVMHEVDDWEDDPDNPGLVRHVRRRVLAAEPPISSPAGVTKATPLSTLIQIALPQRILDSADRHIEREKMKPENRLYRALQFHARDVAPAKWLMENCTWDREGDVIRELKESEKTAKRAMRGIA